ncbi:MAG: L-fuconolactonase [Pirellulaceae bacterium]
MARRNTIAVVSFWGDLGFNGEWRDCGRRLVADGSQTVVELKESRVLLDFCVVRLNHLRILLFILSTFVMPLSTVSAKEPVAKKSVAKKFVAKGAWIIDPHTHFKGAEQIEVEAKTNKRRAEDTLGQVVTPEEYRALAKRLGIQATLIVEAVDQEYPQFNDWVIEQAKSDLVCGYIARGDLTSEKFVGNYQRYKKSGYLNGYRFRFTELRGYLNNELARRNLNRLEQDDMVIDLLVEPPQASDIVMLAKEYPKLKIVINHCFRARMEDGKISDKWKEAVATCAKYPNVYCKLSSIVNFADVEAFGQPAPKELQHYLPVLDPCFEAFGEDRIIFATNWGVCSHFGTVDDVVRIATEFLKSKGDSALLKGMRENAIRIYGIKKINLP